LFPSYWGIHLKKKVTPDKIDEKKLSNLDADILEEYKAARKPNSDAAVRIVGLKKYFKRFLWSKPLKAVDGLDLVIDRGTCLALLVSL